MICTRNRTSGKQGAAAGGRVFGLGAAILTVALACQFASAAPPAAPTPLSALFAGQASYINNAEPEPAGQLDAEEDLTYTHNSRSDYVEYPLTLTYGLLPRWDVSAALGGQWQSYTLMNGNQQTASGFGDLPIYTKFKLLDQEDWWASQSLDLRIKVPTASRQQGLGTGNPDYDLAWLVSKDFTSKLTGDFNLGYTWVGNGLTGPLRDQLHYGFALEYIATDKLGLMAQLLTSVPGSQMGQTEVALSAGIGWQLTHRLQVHASLTKGIGSGSHVIDYSATVGATWTFGKRATHDGQAGTKPIK